jgi:hypothetical protein
LAKKKKHQASQTAQKKTQSQPNWNVMHIIAQQQGGVLHIVHPGEILKTVTFAVLKQYHHASTIHITARPDSNGRGFGGSAALENCNSAAAEAQNLACHTCGALVSLSGDCILLARSSAGDEIAKNAGCTASARLHQCNDAVLRATL